MALVRPRRRDWLMEPYDSDFFPWPQVRKEFVSASSPKLAPPDKDHIHAVAAQKYWSLRATYKQYTLQEILGDVVELKDAIRKRVMEVMERPNGIVREPDKDRSGGGQEPSREYSEDEIEELLIQFTFYTVLSSVIEAGDRDEDGDWTDITHESNEARAEVIVEREVGFVMIDKPDFEDRKEQSSPQGLPLTQKERRSTPCEWLTKMDMTEQFGGIEAIEKLFLWLRKNDSKKS
ncbi:hypothetical protein QBC40DRAFT_351859 [Triangularia verruculosa]|uniref:Uncharacterized protein n=1 Tax=Triangularia verruculosa TaxID=2587418 RepID=A0AAN6XA91_9PEZI|nr:hypothetical protein QBC40DRAFT_351859 [Triangularia verruculosa]